MPPWAGYTRVSRVGDRGDRLLSPTLQADRIQGYAKARGVDVVMLDPELDVSGGKAERPILDQAIRAISEGTYAGIIVAQLDRLSRMGILDSLKMIRRIEDAGGKVIAVAENFDDSTPEGRMSRNVHLSIGNMQLERYGESFARSKASAVERGVWPLPVVPAGYRKDPKTRKLTPSPDARKVRRMFELRARGASWAQIADTIGGSPRTARKIVTNRVYLGEIIYAGSANLNAHPPLVDRTLYEAAQLPGARPARSPNPRPALLAGLARCAHCQRSMTPGSRNQAERIYRCIPRKAAGRCPTPAIISQRKLDEYVTSVFLSHIRGGHYAAAQRTNAVDEALRTLEAAEAERDDYQRLTSVSTVGAEHFMAGLTSRVEAVNAAREALGKAKAAVGPTPDAGALVALWDDLSVEERRHVLRSSLSAVFVTKGSGPCAERVRVVDASRPLVVPAGIEPVEGDLVGEIGPAGAEDV